MYWDEAGQGLMFAPKPGKPGDTQAWTEFREYDRNNPHIWDTFVELTERAWKEGRRKIGAHYIMHIIRWDTNVRAEDEPVKVNHNHFPYYARKFLLERPDCKGLFELRPLTRS